MGKTNQRSICKKYLVETVRNWSKMVDNPCANSKRESLGGVPSSPDDVYIFRKWNCSPHNSHFGLVWFEILNHVWRQSWCTNLMLPEQRQGWNNGRDSSTAPWQTRQQSSSSVFDQRLLPSDFVTGGFIRTSGTLSSALIFRQRLFYLAKVSSVEADFNRFFAESSFPWTRNSAHFVNNGLCWRLRTISQQFLPIKLKLFKNVGVVLEKRNEADRAGCCKIHTWRDSISNRAAEFKGVLLLFCWDEEFNTVKAGGRTGVGLNVKYGTVKHRTVCTTPFQINIQCLWTGPW